jgi:hypothetical protein
MMDKSFMEKMRVFLTKEKALASEIDRRFLRSIKAKRREILAGVAQILREGVDDGEFRRVDIEKAVDFFEAVLQGYCQSQFWQDRQYDLNEAVALIHGFFLRGIEKKEGAARGGSR